MKHAIARKRRSHEAITMGSKLFSKAVEDKDHEMAALVAYWTTLNVAGPQGILRALDAANSYLDRKRLWKKI